MNFAHIGNLGFERGEEESVPDFRDRVRAVVAELGGGVLAWGAPEELEWIDAEPDPEPEAIIIRGGLEREGHENFAQFGDAFLKRTDGEFVESFQIRARDAARAAGAGFVTFGGLPKMNVSDDETKGE